MSMLITGLLLTAAAAESSVPMEPLEGSVGPYQGRQTMFINGEPQTPLVYVLTEQSRFTWQALPQRHMRQFAEAGHRMYQFDVWFRDVWAEDDSLDIALVQRQIRGILNVCPDAALFMRVNVRAPMWWNRRYPDECAQFATGPIAEGGRDDPEGDLERGLRCSFASEQWREDAGRQLTRFCNELLATEESNHIVGMQVTGGIYGEWHHWSFIGHHPDVGPAMTRRFRAWLREAYDTDAALQEAWGDPDVTLDTAEPPGVAPRLESQAGVFRDPARERRMIDYGHCHQKMVEECVLHFCRTAKASWPRPLIIGIFHNYFFYQKEMVEGGHLELAKILESPYIDYLSAPFSYDSDARWPGGTGHPRGLLETVRLNGKLWMNEVDQPTHVGDIVGRPWPETPRTESESIAIMRRNFLQSFCRGHGAWWYDFGPKHTDEGATGWFGTPGLMEEVRKLRVRADEVRETPYAPQADVLMVYDTECFYYLSLPESPDYTSYASINRSQALIHHAGVMADSILLQDLPKAELDRYKVVMLMQTPLLNEEQIAFIRDRVATDGRTVVWSYAPGYTDGESLSLDRVCEATGFTLAPMSLDGETATIEITSDDLPAVTYPVVETSENVAPPPYPVDRKPDPLFAVDDPDAEVLGVFSGGGAPALARKRHDDHTAWYTSLPPLHSALLREICRDAGAHVYVDSDDTLLAGGGMVVLHTVTGGPRELRLRNGRTVEVELPPFSTKVFDAETGADLLDSKVMTSLRAIPVPELGGPWTRIHAPGPKAFPGPDGPTLRAGAVYDAWIPNDHTFVQDSAGVWHCFGITGPASAVLHEAEWQAFHISGAVGDASWTEHDLVLTPADRSGDRRELWAPFVIARDGEYHMFYGPERMGHAVSPDLFRWRPLEPAFVQEGAARDPWIVVIDGRYHMAYVAGDAVWLRTSEDLTTWSTPEAPLFTMRRPGHPESPMLVPYAGRYYLFWTIYDGTNSAYDNRTFVWVSDKADDFSEAVEIATLDAHAPEIFVHDGQWWISSAEWPERGVSIAPLTWAERLAP